MSAISGIYRCTFHYKQARGIFLVKLWFSDSYFFHDRVGNLQLPDCHKNEILNHTDWLHTWWVKRHKSVFLYTVLNRRICSSLPVSRWPASPDISKTVLHQANSWKTTRTGKWAINNNIPKHGFLDVNVYCKKKNTINPYTILLE